MPFEYIQRIPDPDRDYGFTEYRITANDPEDFAAHLLALDTVIAERPTASVVYTGQPDNGTYDEPPEYYDDVPFEDEPVRNTAPPRQQPSGRSQGVVCQFCGGAVWDNSEDKKGPTSPDYKCKDKNGCDAAAWIQNDGTLNWVKGSRGRARSSR